MAEGKSVKGVGQCRDKVMNVSRQQTQSKLSTIVSEEDTSLVVEGDSPGKYLPLLSGPSCRLVLCGLGLQVRT